MGNVREVQQVFSDDFTTVVDETPKINFWKDVSDIPISVMNFINNTSSLKYIFDSTSKKNYCSHCLLPLDDNFKCVKCKRKFDKENKKNRMWVRDISKKVYFLNVYYYVFDVVNQDVVLYLICEEFNHYKRDDEFFRASNLFINKIYLINKAGIKEVIEDEFISFKKLDNELHKTNLLDASYGFYDISISDRYDDTHLYTENLKNLKDTIYKYTNIWDSADYLKNESLGLIKLVYFPIHYPQFEYLIKLKLYNIAYYCPFMIKPGHSFKSTFGVDKKFLKFMQDENIFYHSIKILNYCNTNDKKVLQFALYYSDILEEIVLTTKVKIDKLKKYFDDKNYEYEYIYEYYDYIKCASKLKLNLKDKNVLYPDDLFQAHEKLYLQVDIFTNKGVNMEIRDLSSILDLNKYEDDNYVIFPASSVELLFEESRQQSNCVRTYIEGYSNNDCQIYFMRKKNDIEKSFVTIEVRNGKVVQARTRFNELPSQEILDILNNWERELIMVSH